MNFFDLKKISNYKALIFKEVSAQVFEKIVRIFVGLVVIKSLSFYLGPENYGVLNFIESYYLILYGLAMFGLDIVITKNLVKLKEKQGIHDLISNSIFLLFILSLIFYSLNILILNNFIDFRFENLILLISLLLFLNPFLVIEYFLTSKNQLRYISFVRLIAYLISSSLKLTAIYYKVELEIFIIIMMIENIMVFIGYIYLMRNKIKLFKYKLNINLNILLRIFKESLPIFLYGMGAILYSRIDIFMIQRYLTETDLGNYTASFKLIAFLMFLPGILSTSFFPKIVAESDYSLDSVYIKKMYRYTFYFSIFLLIFCLISGPIMINLLFGEKFESSLLIYNILIFIIVISSISAVYTKVIYSVNLQDRLLLRSIIGIFINIICNYFFIKAYGVVGSAIATILSLIFVELIYDFFDPKLKPYHQVKLKSILTYEK